LSSNPDAAWHALPAGFFAEEFRDAQQNLFQIRCVVKKHDDAGTERSADRARALEAFQLAASLDPVRTAFRARYAARLWENEHYVEAVAEWQTIAAQEPRNLEARVALARAYLKMGERGPALREYRRVLALSPGHAEARQSVARLSMTR